MELTIKDLAKYLPYGLNFKFGDSEKEIESLQSDDIIPRTWMINEDRECGLFLDNVKYIMRPLSQLVEEITHDGKTFVPIVELAKMSGLYKENDKIKTIKFDSSTDCIFEFNNNNDSLTFWVDLDELGLSFGVVGANNCCHESVKNQELLFQKLYEWHFWTGDQSLFKQGVLIEK